MEWLCPASILYTGVQSYTAFHVFLSPQKIRKPKCAPSDASAAVDNVEEMTESRKKIVKSVLSLYQFKYTDETFDVLSENVTFEDPAVYFKGVDSLKNALNLIKSFIKNSETIESEEHHFEHEMRIDFTQKYTTILGIPVTITSALYLKLEGELGKEKVIGVVEEWGKKCLLNGHNTPFLSTGSMATTYRKVHGKICSFFPKFNQCFNSKVGDGSETYVEIK
jgi:hypothetical protein